MRRYTIIVERAQDNYSAYVPDLPGCITTGKTAADAMSNMQEAISLHLQTMQELGIPIPEPSTSGHALPNGSEAHQIEVAA